MHLVKCMVKLVEEDLFGLSQKIQGDEGHLKPPRLHLQVGPKM